MRNSSWWRAAGTAVDEMSDRPDLWVAGALAWMVSVGWLALLVGVVRPPSVGELTILGAAIFTSGAWPWNAIAILAAGLVVLVAGEALFAVAEAAIQRSSLRRSASIGSIFVLATVCSVPALALLLAGARAGVIVAPVEFNSPAGGGGPLLRTALRLAPFIVGAGIALVAGAAIHAAATRRGVSVGSALRAAPGDLVRAGWSAAIAAVGLFVVRIGYAAVVAVLLRVLWEPVAGRVARSGIDAAVLLLLVGFVAIWLCLVLAGGALHAWGSLTWNGVLGAPARIAKRTADKRAVP
jgi:hypothetical protein